MGRFSAAFWVMLFAFLLAPVAASAAPVERFVLFEGADGVSLAGLLTLPDDDDEAPFPAMLLLQGSGPTDRDGNQLPEVRTNLLRQLAWNLAEQGIATLRFDKRGMHANVRELPQDFAALRDFVAWENFVGDAERAYRWLAADSSIDGERVGIAGHSEGGLIALQAVQRGGAKPRVLVLLATPGRPFGAVIADQLTALMERQGASDAEQAEILGQDKRIRAGILATGEIPDDVPPGLQPLYPAYLGRYYQSLLQFDPAKALEVYDGPSLVLAGGADRQVSPERDFPPLSAILLAKDNGSAAFVAPGVSHNLKPVAGEDPGFEGLIDAGLRAELKDWLADKLKDEDAVMPRY